jgi:hypoxanthine phosphoribosyltransferase
MDQVRIRGKDFKLFISGDEIEARLDDAVQKLRARYRDQNPLFLSILNGSFIFASDLIRRIDFPCEISFVRLASYSGLESTGKVEVVYGVNTSIRDKSIVILEDIVDTGATLNFFVPFLQERSPRSVSVVTLLIKREKLMYDLPIEWVGFDIPDKFVIGYGLDYDEQGRNLPGIYQLAP